MDDNVLSTLIHTWAEILGNIVSVAAFSAAAWWFLATTKFKPRIQFDLECNFLEIDKSSDSLIAELQLIFENKGFVEHRLYDVNISIHTVHSTNDFEFRPETNELLFDKKLQSRVSIVPKRYGFYFVRPGVRQVITHIIVIPKSLKVIRVTAGFTYDRSHDYPHTSRRVFKVPPSI